MLVFSIVFINMAHLCKITPQERNDKNNVYDMLFSYQNSMFIIAFTCNSFSSYFQLFEDLIATSKIQKDDPCLEVKIDNIAI